jgi:hypothetical protein
LLPAPKMSMMSLPLVALATTTSAAPSPAVPPIVPEVKSDVDISNFDHFDEAPEDEFSELPPMSSKGAETNMPFLGYTFKRYDDKRPALADMGAMFAANPSASKP